MLDQEWCIPFDGSDVLVGWIPAPFSLSRVRIQTLKNKPILFWLELLPALPLESLNVRYSLLLVHGATNALGLECP